MWCLLSPMVGVHPVGLVMQTAETLDEFMVIGINSDLWVSFNPTRKWLITPITFSGHILPGQSFPSLICELTTHKRLWLGFELKLGLELGLSYLSFPKAKRSSWKSL